MYHRCGGGREGSCMWMWVGTDVAGGRDRPRMWLGGSREGP